MECFQSAESPALIHKAPMSTPDKYEFSPIYLSLLAIAQLYVVTGRLSVGNLLNGQGETQLNMKFLMLTAGIGFPLSYVLTYYFGIVGFSGRGEHRATEHAER